jgi:hypothetical protein
MSAVLQTLGWTASAAPVGSWERLLKSALRTEYYSSFSLVKLLPIVPEQAVEDIEPVKLGFYFDHLAAFRNPGYRGCGRRLLNLPGDTIPRLAAVEPWFHLERSAHVFAPLDLRALERFQPRCVMAPPDVLVQIARAAVERGLRLDALELAISLAGIHKPPMGRSDRDLFWNVFRTPVHEQFRGYQGELLAAECEFHDGLHVQTKTAVMEADSDGQLLVTSMGNLRYPVLRLATELTVEILQSGCACGRTSPKLRFTGTRGMTLMAEQHIVMSIAGGG